MYDPPRPEGSKRRRAAALRAHARASKVGAPYRGTSGDRRVPCTPPLSLRSSDCGRRWLREASLHSPGRLRRDTTEPWAVRADRRIPAGAGRPRERPKNHVVCQGADRTNMPCFFLRYVILALGTHTVPFSLPLQLLSPRVKYGNARVRGLGSEIVRKTTKTDGLTRTIFTTTDKSPSSHAESQDTLATEKSLRRIGEPYPRLGSVPTYSPRMRG